MYNRKTFFDNVKKTVFRGRFNSKQVEGLDLILDEAERRRTPLNHLAYIMATALHETASTMQPIREYGRGRGKKYGIPHSETRQVYYGRGYVQLTWHGNYLKASSELGFNFVDNPDKVMEPKFAIQIMFEGMTEGWFTSKKLSDYLDSESGREDFKQARYIVNGRDKRVKIAGYALSFQTALGKAKMVNKKPLSKSRTMKGAGVGVVVGSGALVEPVVEVSDVIAQNQENLSSGTVVGVVVGVVVIAAAIYVLYSRWDDAGRPSL